MDAIDTCYVYEVFSWFLHDVLVYAVMQSDNQQLKTAKINGKGRHMLLWKLDWWGRSSLSQDWPEIS